MIFCQFLPQVINPILKLVCVRRWSLVCRQFNFYYDIVWRRFMCMQNFSSCWRSEMIILRFSNAAHCQKVILGSAGSRYITSSHCSADMCYLAVVVWAIHIINYIYRNLIIPIHNSQKYGGKAERVPLGLKMIVKARLAGPSTSPEHVHPALDPALAVSLHNVMRS